MTDTPTPSSAEVIEGMREDAERWRALLSSQRMHFMGSAGFTLLLKDGSKKLSDVTGIELNSEYGHMHFGMEFWDRHDAYKDPRYPDNFERKLLTLYVDTIRRRVLALPDSKPDNQGGA